MDEARRGGSAARPCHFSGVDEPRQHAPGDCESALRAWAAEATGSITFLERTVWRPDFLCCFRISDHVDGASPVGFTFPSQCTRLLSAAVCPNRAAAPVVAGRSQRAAFRWLERFRRSAEDGRARPGFTRGVEFSRELARSRARVSSGKLGHSVVALSRRGLLHLFPVGLSYHRRWQVACRTADYSFRYGAAWPDGIRP